LAEAQSRPTYQEHCSTPVDVLMAGIAANR
jgi:hypothetical protein